MIISFNGDHGAGKSTIAQLVSEKLNYPRYYMGKMFRELAKKKGMTLEELLDLRIKDPKIDNEIDDYMVSLSKKYSDFVIESRTAWHFIPQSLKIYLEVSDKEGAKRIFEELQKNNERNEAKNLETQADVLESIRKRKLKDDKIYRKYYGINIRKKENYDLFLNTDNLTIDEVFSKVIDFIKTRIDEKSS